jgi:Trypsin-co-occurring domain 2
MHMADQPSIPLAKAIEDLRAELLKALREGVDQELQFRLKPIELELKLAVTKGGEGNTGVKFWVIELGAKGSYESATTHTLKLTLEPVGKDGKGEIRISKTGATRPD